MAEQGFLFAECPHDHTVVIPEKRSSVHYAKLLCSDCHKFLKWLPKPESVQRSMMNRETLTKLSKIENLDEWTRGFVRSVSSLKHLSPKQQSLLDDLRRRHLDTQAV